MRRFALRGKTLVPYGMPLTAFKLSHHLAGRQRPHVEVADGEQQRSPPERLVAKRQELQVSQPLRRVPRRMVLVNVQQQRGHAALGLDPVSGRCVCTRGLIRRRLAPLSSVHRIQSQFLSASWQSDANFEFQAEGSRIQDRP